MVVAIVLLAVLTVLACVIGGLYLYGRQKQRLIALGKDTYIRFYPNPGLGIAWKDRCYMVSAVRGVECLERVNGIWRRRWARLNRV